MNDQPFSLKGRRALITGGANGLGRMIAEGFLRAGAEVIVTSRRSAASAAEKMSALGNCIGLDADLTSADGTRALAAQVQAMTGELHVLVNNAGRTWGAPLEEFPDRGWPSVLTVNLQAPFILVQNLLPLLKAAGQPEDPARVLNISSVAGLVVEKNLDVYSYVASKAAITQLSRQLAAELAVFHIAVNTIVPGYFPTGMTAHLREETEKVKKLTDRIPLGRLGCAEDIAGLAVFMASRSAAYITGATIPVDGGLIGCR